MGIIASAIRYILLKIMKKLRPPDDKRPAIAAVDQLFDKLMPSAFRVFRDSKFREVARFDKLDQVEHDRIFNELPTRRGQSEHSENTDFIGLY